MASKSQVGFYRYCIIEFFIVAKPGRSYLTDLGFETQFCACFQFFLSCSSKSHDKWRDMSLDERQTEKESVNSSVCQQLFT